MVHELSVEGPLLVMSIPAGTLQTCPVPPWSITSSLCDTSGGTEALPAGRNREGGLLGVLGKKRLLVPAIALVGSRMAPATHTAVNTATRRRLSMGGGSTAESLDEGVFVAYFTS